MNIAVERRILWEEYFKVRNFINRNSKGEVKKEWKEFLSEFKEFLEKFDEYYFCKDSKEEERERLLNKFLDEAQGIHKFKKGE